MNVCTTLDGRVTMDQAAFAQFCETHSMTMCGPGPCSPLSRQVTVDADGDRVMLETTGEVMRGSRILPDLHKAAQAGRVDGALMATSGDGERCLKAAVFRDSDTWAGWANCLNGPVDIGPCTTRLVEVPGGEPFELLQRVEGSAAKHRVHRFGTLRLCCACGGYDANVGAICRNEGKRFADNDPGTDITKLMPSRATGQLGKALVTAAGFVGPEGRRELGRVAWNAAEPGQHNMFRRWLETIEEATGERHVVWVPDLFGTLARNVRFGTPYGKRPVCADTGVTPRGGPCPGFLVSDTATSDTIRVPAHVDNVSLANAAQLAADGADPADAVAVISAIMDPDRR